MTASTIRSGEAGLLSTAQTLADLAREVAPTTEADRALAPDLLDALRAQGLFALGVPRSLGGGECPPGEALVAAETIARGDASPGWCVSIATTSGLLGAYLPDEGAQEVFGDPRSAAAGVAAHSSASSATASACPGLDPRVTASPLGRFWRPDSRLPSLSPAGAPLVKPSGRPLNRRARTPCEA